MRNETLQKCSTFGEANTSKQRKESLHEKMEKENANEEPESPDAINFCRPSWFAAMF